MMAVGITENVKGDLKKFEIWYNAREEVYIIQVGSAPTQAARGTRGPRTASARSWGLESPMESVACSLKGTVLG